MKKLATQVGHSLTCFLRKPWCSWVCWRTQGGKSATDQTPGFRKGHVWKLSPIGAAICDALRSIVCQWCCEKDRLHGACLESLGDAKKSKNTLRGQGGEASWWLAPAAVGCYCMQLLETIQFLGEIGAGSRRSFSSHTLKSCSHCQFSM